MLRHAGLKLLAMPFQMRWPIVALLLTLAGCSTGDAHPPRHHSAAPDSGLEIVFNALDYGAVGDDGTDNTEAFSKCLRDIIQAGGGRMVIPDGVYRGRIVIPPVSRPIPSWMTIEIVGRSQPTHVFGTIGSFPLRDRGTIIKCLDEKGPAVIHAERSQNSLYDGFSGVNVVLRNLDVRTYDNPMIGGIDLRPAQFAGVNKLPRPCPMKKQVVARP